MCGKKVAAIAMCGENNQMKLETYKVILLFPVRGQTIQYGSLAPKSLCFFHQLEVLTTERDAC